MILGLNSFRALAFLAVFLYHVDALPFGYLGVHAFFVLSGFLITPILVDMRRDLPPRAYVVNFFARRSLRIFPAYYTYLATLLLMALVAMALLPPTRGQEIRLLWSQLPFAATYTFNFFHASSEFQHSWYLAHLWSLAVEEQFYLLWPLVVFLAGERRLRTVLLVMIGVSPVVRGVLALHASGNPDFIGMTDLAVYVLPFSHGDAFAFGAYAALYAATPSMKRIAVLASSVVAIGLLTDLIVHGQVYWSSLGYRDYMVDSYKYVWGYSLFGVLFSAVLLRTRARAFFPRAFEWRRLADLGRISYGLYLFHMPIVWWAEGALRRVRVLSTLAESLPPEARPLLLTILALPATIAVAALSYRWIEEPCLRLKDRFFPHAPAAVTDALTRERGAAA